MMHVLMVCHYYPPHSGGIEYVARGQAERLAAAGHTVTVVTSKVSAEEQDVTSKNLKVRRVPAWNGLQARGAAFPIFGPRIFRELYNEVQRADVVQVHDALFISSFVAVVWARVLKKPVVLMQHVGLVTHDSRLAKIVQRLMYATGGRFIFASSRRILTLNDTVEAFLLRYGVPQKKLQHIHNGTDLKLYRPAQKNEKKLLRNKYGLSQTKKIILFVGRPVPKKGFAKLAAAARDSYEIVSVGGPGALATRQIKSLGILPQNEIAEVYRAADMFVLPSIDEGFPMSVQEAMASGLPVITTNDPGYARYHLDHSKIRLIQPTKGAVKRAIQDLVSDKKLMTEMSLYSRAYALKTFDWKQVIDSLVTTYEEVRL